MIAFKVVEKGTRHCSNIMLCKKHFLLSSTAVEKYLKRKRRYPQYFPRYLKGRTIYAADGSVGIMCFESRVPAKDFIKRHQLEGIAKIIRVEGIGLGIVPRKIVCGCGDDPMRLVQDPPRGRIFSSPPVGTIAFKAVRVLE